MGICSISRPCSGWRRIPLLPPPLHLQRPLCRRLVWGGGRIPDSLEPLVVDHAIRVNRKIRVLQERTVVGWMPRTKPRLPQFGDMPLALALTLTPTPSLPCKTPCQYHIHPVIE